MKQIYKDKEITKRLLDSLKIGDCVKCNDWKYGMTVKGVTENYFVMHNPISKEYSVCEKKKFEGIGYNSLVGGYFSIGTDNWIFGAPMENAYEFDNEKFVKEYLNAFENGDCELSMRRSCALVSIEIRR